MERKGSEMSAVLSDDLSKALHDHGVPLRVVDPATGEAYLLVPAADFAASSTAAVGEPPMPRLTNARLLELAARHAPPAAWLEGDFC